MTHQCFQSQVWSRSPSLCLTSKRCRSACQPALVRRCESTQHRCHLRHQRRHVKVNTAKPNPVTGALGGFDLKSHGAVFSVQAVFAMWYIVGHLVLADNDPLTFALAREFFSAIALVAMAKTIEGDFKVKSRSDLLDITVLGVFCYGVVMGFMFALSDIPEVQVAIAQPLVPALALGISAVLGTEKLSFVSGSGILLSIAGAIAFTFYNSTAGDGGSNGHAFGYIALAFELFAYAGQLTYLPRVSRKYGPITLTAMYYLVASVLSGATLVIRERNELDQLWAQASIFQNPVVLAALGFAVLGPTVYCFTLLSYTSKKLKPSVTSSYITLQPVMVAVMSLVLFGTMLSREECGSGALVILGLYLSIIGNPRMDRVWAEYLSDLPTNVPNTIATVAESSANAASAVSDTVVDAAGTVSDTVTDAAVAVGDRVTDAAVAVSDKMAGYASTVSDGIVGVASTVSDKVSSANSKEQDSDSSTKR